LDDLPAARKPFRHPVYLSVSARVRYRLGAITARSHGLKPNYQYEKRQRELEKKKKKAEKELKKGAPAEAPPEAETATEVPPENK
jgi:hypothetical protein